MTQVTKGAFVADRNSGSGNGTVKITVPKNETGSPRYQQFVIKNADRTKQIIVFCRQNPFVGVQKLDFVYEFVDRGIYSNDGTNVILEGRLSAYKKGTTQRVDDPLFYNPMVKIGYTYNDIPTVKYSKVLDSNFKYEDFNLLIPIEEYEQANPFITFNQEDSYISGSNYQYDSDLYSVANLGSAQAYEFYDLVITNQTEITEAETVNGDSVQGEKTNISGYISIKNNNAENVINPKKTTAYLSLVHYIGPDANDSNPYEILYSDPTPIDLSNPVNGKVSFSAKIPGWIFRDIKNFIYLKLTFNKLDTPASVTVDSVTNQTTYADTVRAQTDVVVNNVECLSNSFTEFNSGTLVLYGYNASSNSSFLEDLFGTYLSNEVGQGAVVGLSMFAFMIIFLIA